MVATAPPPAIRVAVNDRVLPVAPVEVHGRILVPMRAIFEALGARVAYDASSSTVDASTEKHHVTLTIGAPRATVDGRSVSLDVPAQVVADRAFVPLRFVSTALGANVGYDAASRLVNVTLVQIVAFHGPSVTYQELPTPPPPAQSSNYVNGDLSSGMQLDVGGRWFAPGSPILVRLTAPPGGRAYVLLCTSDWRYEMFAAPDSPYYSTTVYAPRVERIDSCPIVAMYVAWNGLVTYSPYPIFVRFPGLPIAPVIAGTPTPAPMPTPILQPTPVPQPPRRIKVPEPEPRKTPPATIVRRSPPPI